jgi:hypothetical protein
LERRNRALFGFAVRGPAPYGVQLTVEPLSLPGACVWTMAGMDLYVRLAEDLHKRHIDHQGDRHGRRGFRCQRNLDEAVDAGSLSLFTAWRSGWCFGATCQY